MADNDWKARLGMVYSTDPDYHFETAREEEPATLPPAQQELRVWLDRKQRGGKQVTLVRGFVGTQADLIQGDHRDRVVEILLQNGYRCKKAGGK